MSWSKVEMCNMALGKAGVTQPIQSLEFADGVTVPNEARMCKLYWQIAFEAAARDHDWKCLTRRADISGSLTTAPAFGFTYAYSLPADCLRVLRMEDLDSEWVREGRLLYTDETEVHIGYIRRTEDTDLFDPHFVEALVTLLASHLATALGGEEGAKRATELGYWYERVCLPRARLTDSCEQSTVTMEATTWTGSRL